MRLRKLHAASGLVIAMYAVVHIANHLAALGGIEAHITFMRAARTVYRFPVVEAILFICVLCADPPPIFKW
jgi:succinate dehydrogenase/fumarate reductase cytochrome b subunit